MGQGEAEIGGAPPPAGRVVIGVPRALRSGDALITSAVEQPAESQGEEGHVSSFHLIGRETRPEEDGGPESGARGVPRSSSPDLDGRVAGSEGEAQADDVEPEPHHDDSFPRVERVDFLGPNGSTVDSLELAEEGDEDGGEGVEQHGCLLSWCRVEGPVARTGAYCRGRREACSTRWRSSSGAAESLLSERPPTGGSVPSVSVRDSGDIVRRSLHHYRRTPLVTARERPLSSLDRSRDSTERTSTGRGTRPKGP